MVKLPKNIQHKATFTGNNLPKIQKQDIISLYQTSYSAVTWRRVKTPVAELLEKL
jgi:hypothetical protein